MQSLTVIPQTKKFELVHGPVPKISTPEQVLIKVAYAGFYESGLQLLEENADSERLRYFRNEISGTILDLGSEVTLFKKEIVSPGCGRCFFCRSGRPHYCSMGSDKTIGTWASFVVVPFTRVHKVPDDVTLQQAGILGSLWARVLYHQGHRNVTIIDNNHNKLESIRRINTGFTLTTRDELRSRDQYSSNYNFDLVLETSGDPSVMEQALNHLQKGGKLCCCQMALPNAEFSVYPFEVFMRELKIFGVNEKCFTFHTAIKLIEEMENRYLDYESLGIQIFPLEAYRDAVEAIKSGSVEKIVFSME
nr:unnamed protein product [Callosobruchus chinensis]